jgi:hypothetical protein
MSVLELYRWFSMISGLMKYGVPICVDAKAAVLAKTLDTPKSPNFNNPADVRKIFYLYELIKCNKKLNK